MRLRDERTAALLGVALGISVLILMATGLVSHLIQHPPGWLTWPARPANTYRVTQGIHVAAGIATVPLLLAKLFVIYPKLFVWPPARDIPHLIERLTLFPLVGGTLFMLASGLWNVAGFEPWGFFFPVAHYWGSFITIGALITHVAAKAAVTRRGLSRPAGGAGGAAAPEEAGLSRRGFIGAIAAASAALTVTTIGQTVSPLRRLALLAPRDPKTGPQGVPVNKTARAAGVIAAATDSAWRLRIEGNVPAPLELSLEDVRAMAAHTADLPIACVQGWSAPARWRGVRLADVLDRAGASPDASLRVESLQPAGQYRASSVNRLHARDRDTLLAYDLHGAPLHLDHGYPLRLIGPNRPGVMQTKWVTRLVVE